MLDIVGSIAAAAICVLLIGVLLGAAPVRRSTKLAVGAVAAVWGVFIVSLAAVGSFAPGTLGPIPGAPLFFVLSVILLFGSWFLVPGFRNALTSVPLSALIGVNALRLGGIFFLILTARGRLTGPFGPIAGAGDMVVGALAIVLAARASRGEPEHPGWFRAWNALGALDLIVAVSLGALSAPATPFRVFREGVGTQAMGELPWTIVPTILVPLYLLIHLTIATKLRSARTAPSRRAEPEPRTEDRRVLIAQHGAR